MQQQIVKKDFKEHFANLVGEFKFSNCLIVTSNGNEERGYADYFINELEDNKCNISLYKINEYPNFFSISNIFEENYHKNIDLILSIGGGSVLDISKILAACKLPKNSMEIITDLELSSDDKIFNISIPTTAGSGAESTKFATIWSKSTKQKYSFEDPKLLPEVAYFIPEYTTSLPKFLTLTTALDALCHSIDSLWNKKSNSNSIDLSIQSTNQINTYLPKLLREMDNIDYRYQLLDASNLAGRAINITRTSLNHSISYPLTNLYDLPHGYACAFSIVSICNEYEKEIRQLPFANTIFEARDLISAVDLASLFKDYLIDLDIDLVCNNVFDNKRLSNFLFDLSHEKLNKILSHARDYYVEL
tara:strand:+ start:4633 stop:5715 length:1083 start_codon:yes stop_codon:yes gene_type:complete